MLNALEIPSLCFTINTSNQSSGNQKNKPTAKKKKLYNNRLSQAILHIKLTNKPDPSPLTQQP